MANTHSKPLVTDSIKPRTVGILRGFNSNSSRMAVAAGSPQLSEAARRGYLVLISMEMRSGLSPYLDRMLFKP